jgi:hypothetical protein
MGWMRRMVPGVDEMETGEAVTVLPIGKNERDKHQKSEKEVF